VKISKIWTHRWTAEQLELHLLFIYHLDVLYLILEKGQDPCEIWKNRGDTCILSDFIKRVHHGDVRSRVTFLFARVLSKKKESHWSYRTYDEKNKTEK